MEWSDKYLEAVSAILDSYTRQIVDILNSTDDIEKKYLETIFDLRGEAARMHFVNCVISRVFARTLIAFASEEKWRPLLNVFVSSVNEKLEGYKAHIGEKH